MDIRLNLNNIIQQVLSQRYILNYLGMCEMSLFDLNEYITIIISIK